VTLSKASRGLLERRAWLAAVLAACVALAPAVARAQAAEDAGAPDAAVTAPEPPAPASKDEDTPKRPVPDLDGRGPEPATPGEGALWVPRVTLFPLWLVSEYVIRKPIGWLMFTTEKYKLPTRILDFVTFGDDDQVRIVPTAFVDFGMRPSVGLYFRWRDLGVKDNSLRIYAGTWGVHWLRLVVNDRYDVSRTLSLTTRGEAVRRGDYLYAGVGWNTNPDAIARYSADTLQGSFTLEWMSPVKDRWLKLSSVIRRTGSDDSTYHCCEGAPTIPEAVAAGAFPQPPGYPLNYTMYQERLDLAWDTRTLEARDRSGFRMEGYVAPTFARSDVPLQWLEWGGGLGVFVDVTGQRRVLGLYSTMQFVDAIGNTEVPFTELVSPIYMQGFLPGRLRGASAFTTTFQYRWPIWFWLDGETHVTVGNTFGPHLEDFDAERLRLSFGIGVRSNGRPDQAFELLIAAGSEPFVNGTRLSAARFIIGSSPKF
jgi:hypothetical protein